MKRTHGASNTELYKAWKKRRPAAHGVCLWLNEAAAAALDADRRAPVQHNMTFAPEVAK